MDNDKKIFIKCRAVILHQGKLLMVRHPHDTSFAALPGGYLEWGEDLRECVQREIMEELGVYPEIGRLLYVNTFTQKDNKHYIEFFFEVINADKYVNLDGLTRSHAEEIAEIVWVNPGDAVRIMPIGLGEDFKNGKIISDMVRYIKD